MWRTAVPMLDPGDTEMNNARDTQTLVIKLPRPVSLT
jgi:hypothetical protein